MTGVNNKKRQAIGLAITLIFGALLLGHKADPVRQIDDSIIALNNSPVIYTQGARGDNLDTEYLIIDLPINSGDVLAVTGWRLVGGVANVGIGRAAILPKQGQINEQGVITLTRPSKLVINTGESPVGVSFRENACTGLFGELQDFTPPLSPVCSTCNHRNLEGHPEYNLCVEAHKDEPDFFYNTWRIYLGNNKALWRDALEVIKLYDQTGKLLSITSY